MAKAELKNCVLKWLGDDQMSYEFDSFACVMRVIRALAAEGIPVRMNAGHYKSVGSTPALRFNEGNVHLQCEHCNSYLSGNIGEYRPRLIAKIGLEMVEFLEGPHEPKKYTIDELKELIATYKEKVKALQ